MTNKMLTFKTPDINLDNYNLIYKICNQINKLTNKNILLNTNYIKYNLLIESININKLYKYNKIFIFKQNCYKFTNNCYYLLINKDITFLIRHNEIKYYKFYLQTIIFCPIYLYNQLQIPITIKMILTNTTTYNIYLFGEYLININTNLNQIIIVKKYDTLSKVITTNRKIVNHNKFYCINTKVINLIQNIIINTDKNNNSSTHYIREVDESVQFPILQNTKLFKYKKYLIEYKSTIVIEREYSRLFEDYVQYFDFWIDYLKIDLYYGYMNKTIIHINLYNELKYLDIESKIELWKLKQKYDGKLMAVSKNQFNYIHFLIKFDLNVNQL